MKGDSGAPRSQTPEGNAELGRLTRVRQVGFLLERCFGLWKLRMNEILSLILCSSPNDLHMKSDGQPCHGIFNAASLSASLSACLISRARLILPLFLWVLQQ